MKLLWFDTETTGLDPSQNDIVQIAGKIIIDNDEKEEFNLFCQPHSFENISEKALETNGFTIEKLKSFPDPTSVYAELDKMFSKYIDRYNKSDKFIPCGQNVRFDVNFLSEYWRKCGNNYFFSFVGAASLDTMQLAVMLEMKKGKKIFSSYKLEILFLTLFGSDMEKAHDALADIEATILVSRELWSQLFDK
jgi:DNA polymerase-3 subunit epsilon